MGRNVSPCRGYSFRPTFCENALWQNYCLYDSRYTKTIVSTNHIHCHKGMRALSKQPPARPKNFRQVPPTNVTHHNSSFSKILDHASFAPRTRHWPYHFPSLINCLGPNARTISLPNVLPHIDETLAESIERNQSYGPKRVTMSRIFFSTKMLRENALWQKYCLYDFRYKERIVSTKHIHRHDGDARDQLASPGRAKKF